MAAVVSALAVGCGEEPTAADFDPTVAEEYVRNKARADVRANPELSVQAPQSPDVTCRERTPEDGPPPEEDETATFICDVKILSRSDRPLGRQTWRTEVELEPATTDTIVRSSRRLGSTIDPAR